MMAILTEKGQGWGKTGREITWGLEGSMVKS